MLSDKRHFLCKCSLRYRIHSDYVEIANSRYGFFAPAAKQRPVQTYKSFYFGLNLYFKTDLRTHLIVKT